MNATCALQHFCDYHGPQTLLCTEVKGNIQDSTDTEQENLRAIFSQYVKAENPPSKGDCKSCTLSSEKILVSTIDTTNHMLYITSPSTPNQELFKDIRNACVRSLNIEKSADVDYPILFGDDDDGFCLSLTFSCKDFHARGSQRLYSLCYLSRDKYSLLSLMSLISECMRQTVFWLQCDANQTFEQEGRIKINTNLTGVSTTYIFRPPPANPSPRMLSDIVHDSKLIYRVHALFSWILRTANSAINEVFYDALPSEEQTTKQERKDAFENENSNTFVPKRRTATIVARSVIQTDVTTSMIPSTLTDEMQNSSYLATSIYSTIDSSQRFDNNLFDDEDFDSLQYQYSTYGIEAFKLFALFIRKLNNTKYLQYILHQWIIGNRLILKYTDLIENKDIIRALASVFRLFLPDGCFQLIETTNQMTSCTANFILFDMDVLTDMNLANVIADGTNENQSLIIHLILDDIDDNIRVVKLETPPPPRSDIPVPTYVRNLVELLTDSSFMDEAFEPMIIQLKMKYLNKAKLYFQFGRCLPGSNSLPSERQQMSWLNVENTSDLAMIRFWQKGLSQAYRKKIRLFKQDDNQHRLRTSTRN